MEQFFMLWLNYILMVTVSLLLTAFVIVFVYIILLLILYTTKDLKVKYYELRSRTYEIRRIR